MGTRHSVHELINILSVVFAKNEGTDYMHVHVAMTHSYYAYMYTLEDVPELLSTLKVIGGFSLEDFLDPSNTHALFTDAAAPSSCIMNDTPAGGEI